MKNLITVTVLAFISLNSFAEDHYLKGKGLDGQSCSAQVSLNGDQLAAIALDGAAKEYQILSEEGDSYGPNSSIVPGGGWSVGQELPDLATFKRSESWLGGSVTYSAEYERAIGYAKAKVVLSYSGSSLKQVTVEIRYKASIVTIASTKFECSK